MADGAGSAARRSSVFRFMVLASARVAGFSRGDSGNRKLAMAGGDPIGAGICGGASLCVGLRLDGTRNSSPDRSAAAPGRGRILPLRAESDVRGLRGWMDWVVDCLR